MKMKIRSNLKLKGKKLFRVLKVGRSLLRKLTSDEKDNKKPHLIKKV